MWQRVVAGGLVAAGIAAVAKRAGSLSRTGAAAATCIGTASVAAGWGWGGLLISYFVTSSLLSRLGAATKERRTVTVVAKGGARDAAQVLANGGIFALGALLTVSVQHPAVAALALGALAASAADTWATEIGTLVAIPPRSILSFHEVAPGMSGGVTLAGSLASIGGAMFVALTARAAGLASESGRVVTSVVIAGILGALADSIIGATLQERRWCTSCKLPTERTVHDCGAATTHAGGWSWMNNDAVNLCATAVGGVVAVALAAR